MAEDRRFRTTARAKLRCARHDPTDLLRFDSTGSRPLVEGRALSGTVAPSTPVMTAKVKLEMEDVREKVSSLSVRSGRFRM